MFPDGIGVDNDPEPNDFQPLNEEDLKQNSIPVGQQMHFKRVVESFKTRPIDKWTHWTSHPVDPWCGGIQHSSALSYEEQRVLLALFWRTPMHISSILLGASSHCVNQEK